MSILRKLRRNRNFNLFLLDLVMLLLLFLNLGLILFDWIFQIEWVQMQLARWVPAFYDFYLHQINEHFQEIDLVFVTIFLTEFLVRWAVAVQRDVYHRWFFYPFVHWYDILGCIPVGSFRFLRILRVFTIVYRLQKLELINVTRTYLYRTFNKYLNVVIEEVSDRVVVNIIEGVQDEVNDGGPVADRIVADVVRPKKDLIAQWLSRRIQRVTAQNYHRHRPDIRAYVSEVINQAVENNPEIKLINKTPVFGGFLKDTLDHAISDIVFNVIDGLVEDLAAREDNSVIHDVTDIVLEAFLMEEEDDTLNAIVKDTVHESLEIVKAQVLVKQWLLRDMEEKAAKERRRRERRAAANGLPTDNRPLTAEPQPTVNHRQSTADR